MVVAMLGILAALALPKLLPVVQTSALQTAGDAVGAAATQARMAALATRRCVRLRLPDPLTLVTEQLNSFDCENPSAPLIDGSQPLWTETARMKLEVSSMTLTLATAPTSTASEIRFRPSGRVFSADANLDDDDAVLLVTHPGLPAGQNTVRVVIDNPLAICVLPRSRLPTGAGNTLSCP